MRRPAVLARIPSGPAYTVVLVLHVVAVLVVAVTLVAGAIAATRLVAARDAELPRSVRAYFSPGPNVAGRALWLVPVLGAALLAMSGGAYRLDEAWVEAGLGMWAGSIALCEGVVWRAERRIRDALAAMPDGRPAPSAVQAARVLRLAAPGVLVLLAAAMAVMLAKP